MLGAPARSRVVMSHSRGENARDPVLGDNEKRTPGQEEVHGIGRGPRRRGKKETRGEPANAESITGTIFPFATAMSSESWIRSNQARRSSAIAMLRFSRWKFNVITVRVDRR